MAEVPAQPQSPDTPQPMQTPAQTQSQIAANQPVPPPAQPVGQQSVAPQSTAPPNQQVDNKIPKKAYFALFTSVLFIILGLGYMYLITNNPSAIGLNEGSQSGGDLSGIILLSIVGMIFPILILLNLILGISTFRHSRKYPNKITTAIGVFSFVIGMLPVLQFFVVAFTFGRY